jgi:hypothetical protein
VIQALPPKVTFISEFFIDPFLPHLVAAMPARDPSRRLVLHMDNASPHRARFTARNIEEKRTTENLRPAFSPDLAPTRILNRRGDCQPDTSTLCRQHAERFSNRPASSRRRPTSRKC